MSNIILTCPVCGMVLEVPSGQQGFTCWYCGTEFHPEGKDMDASLTFMAVSQVEREITGLVSSKERKLDELSRCINAIIRRPEFAIDRLLAQRNRLENDVLELSLMIHLKESTLHRFKGMQSPGSSPGG